MGIPLSEAMNIYPFSRAKLVAGESGLNRMVTSANIQEVPHVEKWLHGGEILFSAGYAFRELENPSTLIEKIAGLGAAALVLKPGQYLKEIPAEFIASANRVGLPLFELPKDVPYMDCIVPVFERLTEKQLVLFRRVENIHGQLMNVMLRQEGLDGICFALSEVTAQPVLIVNARGSATLAACYSRDEGDCGQHICLLKENEDCHHKAYGAKLCTAFEGYGKRIALTSLTPNRVNVLNLSENQRLLCIPIWAQDEYMANLLMDCSKKPLSDMDLMAFEHASSLMAVELLKERALLEKEQRIREQLLEDLLFKRYDDERMIYRRGLSLGVDLREPYLIFSIDPIDFEGYIRREKNTATETEIQRIKESIQGLIRFGLKSLKVPMLLLANSVRMSGMMSVKKEADIRNLKKSMKDILKKLKAAYPKLPFSGGIGSVKTHIREAAQGEKEAKLALACSRLPHFTKNGSVAAFDELGAMSFLSEVSESRTMKSYYEKHLGALEKYDLEHGSELIHTLECYFSCKQNLRLTAEKLYIHKNSVVYRLHKIEGLTGISFNDASEAFDLQLCLLLKNLI